MRFMAVPPFPHMRIADLDSLIKSRLTNEVVIWPDQALPLVGYMAWPENAAARERLIGVLRGWLDGSDKTKQPCRIRSVQEGWARTADIFHRHFDLTKGDHHRNRGGASIGKGIFLVAEFAEAKGTRKARLWEIWKAYKNVAHLVTAVILICSEARIRFAAEGRPLGQISPLRTALLMPDFVISVAMEFERHGLAFTPYGRKESVLDPDTLWRIPQGIGVTPTPPLVHSMGRPEIVALNRRRAGNRGRSESVT